MRQKEKIIDSFNHLSSAIKYQAIQPQKVFDLTKNPCNDKNDESQCFIKYVLSFYPEISPYDVVLKHKSIRTSMACRPIFWSLFKKQRKYEIIINNDPKDNEIPYHEIPLQARIGLIAHELAHILDYQNKSLFQLIQTGLLYIFGTQEKYEKSIDYLTIKKGFGWQVLAWSDYVFNHSQASESYLAFKDKYYFNPNEIASILQANLDYKKTKTNAL